jgi:hypothetical protein
MAGRCSKARPIAAARAIGVRSQPRPAVTQLAVDDADQIRAGAAPTAGPRSSLWSAGRPSPGLAPESAKFATVVGASPSCHLSRVRRLALVLLALSGCYGLAEDEAGVLVLPPAVDLTPGPFAHRAREPRQTHTSLEHRRGGVPRPTHPTSMDAGVLPPEIPGTVPPPSFWSVHS